VNKVNKLYHTIQNSIIKLFMVIVYISSIIIPVSIFCQVVARYFFKSPIAGVEELATASFIWMIIFGSAVLYKEQRHIVVDAFISKRSESTKRIIRIICEILMIIILGVLIYSCYIALPYQKFYKTVVLKISTSTHTKALIVSSLFMLATSLERLIKDIIGEAKHA
jgi:TRAP-type C4-dicarboxylate transport system permease small subunit